MKEEPREAAAGGGARNEIMKHAGICTTLYPRHATCGTLKGVKGLNLNENIVLCSGVPGDRCLAVGTRL